MTILIRLFTLLTLLFFFSLSADQNYRITKLPDGFIASRLNNQGVVSGYYGVNSELSLNGKTVAIWSEKNGIISSSFNPSNGAIVINDQNLVAFCADEQIILWNPYSGDFIWGPRDATAPVSINFKGEMIVYSNPYFLWDPFTNSFLYLSNNPRAINDSGKILYSLNIKFGTEGLDPLALNNFGFILYKAKNKNHFFLEKNGNYTVIVSNPTAYFTHLNDLNEVVGLMETNIVIWENGKTKLIESLKSYPELSSGKYFGIYGFNNNGEILLYTHDGTSIGNRYFLLTPVKS